MEITEKSVEMILCQKEKDAVKKNKKEFLNFVAKSLDSGSIAKASEALLPFDNFVSAKQCFVDESSLIRSMGFSLMRMEMEPSTFSLGISIEICGGSYNNKTNSTLFITAFKTMTQLSEYVRSDGFSSTVTEYFESEIDKSFFSRKQELKLSMGRKKYYGYKKPDEHYEITFWADKGKEGIALYFIYDNGVCGMNKYYWGTEMEYERNKNGEVEANYYWDEENTKKLMLRTGTHNGKDMVKAIYERFKKFKDCANTHICNWCDEKGIQYKTQVWW